jgi:hypothetical protein
MEQLLPNCANPLRIALMIVSYRSTKHRAHPS